MDLLELRVQGLESLLRGREGLGTADEGGALRFRLEKLAEDVSALDDKVPHLRACRELLAQMHVDITKRKTTLASVQERVGELLAAKASITRAVEDLRTMNELAKPSVINFDGLHDIPALEQRLASIEALVAPLVQQAQHQSRQIDDYIDSYTTLIRLVDGVRA